MSPQKEIPQLAIGTAAHGMGTARAMEMGPVEGAMSSLSICVAGIMTAAGASLFPAFGKISQKSVSYF